jgi:hypothetical protein
MLNIIFTLDYEIHGNGDGNPHDLMVEPTERLLRCCDEYGAKLTIMADIAEILKFKEYKETTGRDDYHYDAIAGQLRHAIKTGHDVQLHIHSSYFNARHGDGKWVQDWTEYDFAGLPYDRMDWMIKTGKDFLETLLKPVDPNYQCIAFRAANWSVRPSSNVVQALVNNGIKMDTSVFKYGYRNGLVSFDYSSAHSPIQPWPVKEDDICCMDAEGKLWEIPIYCEKRWIGAFLSRNRIYRAYDGSRHKMGQIAVSETNGPQGPNPKLGYLAKLGVFFKKHAWKADFNQCTGKQIINALNRASTQHDHPQGVQLPFVLIGHSKLFSKRNERDMAILLAYCAANDSKFTFSNLSGINVQQGLSRQ